MFVTLVAMVLIGHNGKAYGNDEKLVDIPEIYQKGKLVRQKNENFYYQTLASEPPTTQQPLEFPEPMRRNKVQYKIIEQRGLAMERRGTLISYDSTELMSVIIRLPPLTSANISTNCSELLAPIDKAYQKAKQRYHNLLTNLLQPTIKVNEIKLCKLVGKSPCKRTKKVSGRRNKRFVAEAMAASALAVSATALGLGIDNRIQLDKLEDYLSTVAEDVKTISTELQSTNNRQAKILNHQKNILGYIADIREDIDTLYEMIECTRLETHYIQWYEEILQKLRDILVYPLQGTLSGNLRPSILSPEDVAYTIADSADNMQDLLTHLPLIFYSSATVTLIGFDIENMVFQFLISYPLLQNTKAILPIFQVFQTGFVTSVQDNENNSTEENEQCLQFHMPDKATRVNEIWHTLTLPADKCPMIGIFSVCPDNAYKLSNLEKCIDLPFEDEENNNHQLHPGCKMENCQDNSAYINLKGGVMLRSNNPSVDVLHKQNSNGVTIKDLTSSTAKMNLTREKTLWIPWRTSLSAVQVDDKIVHNPVDGNFDAKIEVLEAKNLSNIIKLSQNFDTNFESKSVIKEIEQHQNIIETLTHEIDESNKLLDTIGLLIKFYKNPMKYIKVPLIVIGTILLLFLAIFIGFKLKPYCMNVKYSPLYKTTQQTKDSHDTEVTTTTNPGHQLPNTATTVFPTNFLALTATAPTDAKITPSAPIMPEELESPHYRHQAPPLKQKKSKKRYTRREDPYAAISSELDHYYPNYAPVEDYIPLQTLVHNNDI